MMGICNRRLLTDDRCENLIRAKEAMNQIMRHFDGGPLRRRPRFFEAQKNDRNASNHFDFLSVFPALADGIGQGMGDQGQPIPVLVEIAPAADIAGVGQEKVDWAIEFVCPLSAMGDGAPLGID
jgi:hypothetical protein